MSKKSILGQSYGRGKVSQNALAGTLFKRLPRAPIVLKFKFFCVHQIANDQTIVLRPENADGKGLILGFKILELGLLSLL